MKIKINFFLFFCILLFSCKKEKDVATDFGYGYFPDKVGKYVVYDVDSLVYDDFENDTDHYQYRIKEVIESIYLDNSNKPTLRIERYKKNYNPSLSYDSIPWILKDVWSAMITNTTVEQVEENIRYTKLVFPVDASKSWNGNAYNSLGEWQYSYSNMHKPLSINTLYFDSTILVNQLNRENLIEKKYYVEKYAKNTGLIYKEIIDVYSDDLSNPSIPVSDRIKKGIKYKMTVVSYGNQ